jgi:hypothetical protein
MRAFAKNLRISPSLLSRIIAGSMDMSHKTAANVINFSQMTSDDEKLFVDSILDEYRARIQTSVDKTNNELTNNI